MTTIAYCGRFLAADTLATSGNVRMPGARVKLEVQTLPEALGGGQVAFALTGRPALFPRCIEWWLNGAAPQPVPKGWERPDDSCFIVARPGVVEYCWGDAPHMLNAHTPDHWGSGGEYAHAAMLAGMTAPEAVGIAMMMHTHSGGDLQYIDLHEPVWSIRTVPAADVRRWQDASANHRRFMPLPDSWMGQRMGEDPARTKQRHDLYRKAGLLDDDGKSLQAAEHPKGPSVDENAEISPDALITTEIIKPSKTYRNPNDAAPVWLDECSGRLTLGTGCGHCLRCNREWFALMRQTPKVSEIADSNIIANMSKRFGISEQDIKAGLDRQPLELWVQRWNEAARVNDEVTMNRLNVELRGMEFPPNVYLVDEPITNPATMKPYMDRVAKRIMDATAETRRPAT